MIRGNESRRKASSDYIPYNTPDIGQNEIDNITDTLRSGWLAKGPKTMAFEEAFRDYTGGRYAVALNSCTAALHLALLAAGIGPGDEVITTPMTFVSSVNTIIQVGATPVFVDVDPDNGLIDPSMIEAAVTPRTKAVVPVHYAGYACDLDQIYDIAERHNLFVSEDAAHAIDTRWRGELIGAHSSGAVAYSFYATKNIATGEGGMLVTDDEALADSVRVYSSHGMSRNAWNRYHKGGSWRYDVEVIGYKYNMFDLQAAMGLEQLKRLPEFQKRRFEIAERYKTELAGLPGLILPNPDPDDMTPSWHLFVVQIDEQEAGFSRDAFIEQMNEKRIGTSVHFIPVPEMSVYRSRGFDISDYPVTMQFGSRIVSLPLYSKLDDEQVSYITQSIKEIFAGA